MIDGVAPQHQHRNIDHREHAQQKQRRGAAESAGTSPTKVISPKASSVVKPIAT